MVMKLWDSRKIYIYFSAHFLDINLATILKASQLMQMVSIIGHEINGGFMLFQLNPGKKYDKLLARANPPILHQPWLCSEHYIYIYVWEKWLENPQ